MAGRNPILCLAGLVLVSGLLASGLLASGALAQGPPVATPPKPKPPAAPDPVFEAARTAFEALPEAERRGLQDALVWLGDYNSVVTGTFGRRTYDGLLAFQKRTGGAAGLPDGPGRAAILAAGEAARKAARFTVKPDPASGATIGVPERMLPKRAAIPGGTRWQSADGRVTLETRSFAAGEADLDGLFERATAPVPERKVTYKLKRPDFLVVSAETGTGKSYIRHAAGPGGIRGFTIGYDKALSTEIDRVVIAVANSFVPFPGAPSVPPVPATPSVAAKPAVMPVLPPLPGRGVVPAGTGLIVAAGRVLTTAATLEGCPAPRIGGAAAKVVATDPGRNLALLDTQRLPGRSVTGVALSARTAPPGAADALVVLGADVGGAVVVAPGEAGVDGARVVAPLQPGAGGAPVLDRSGALAGLVARFPTAPRLIAGVAPPTSYALVPGRVVAGFLAENAIAPAPAPLRAPDTLGAVAAPFSGAVIGIECPR